MPGRWSACGASAGSSRVSESREFVLRARFFFGDRAHLLVRRLDLALQFGLARFDRALRELRFLRFAFQAAVLFARFCELAREDQCVA